MHRKFNVTGRCYPQQHYMVDMKERLKQIEKMVECGDYFCINRGRQYGKTTILSLLKNELENRYVVFSVSFEGIGEASFESGETLAYAFLCLLKDCLDYGEVKQASEAMKKLIAENISDETGKMPVLKLSRLISRICMTTEKPIVLFIDEVDQAGNYKAFIEFLGMLRDKYLKRTERPTFQSVILAGVYDIKNIKMKMRSQEEHQYNSPWNIAAEFNVEMDFSRTDIEGMLADYEKDHQTGMDVPSMAALIYDYTSGYPFLVCRLCKIIDEKLIGTETYEDEWKVL